MTRRPSEIDNDDNDAPGLIGKVMQHKKLGATEYAEAGEIVTGMLPGAFQAVSLPFAGARGALTSEEERLRYERLLGESLERAAYRNRGIRAKLAELKGRWKNNMAEAAVSTGGAVAGMAIGTALLPGLGTLAGLAVGGASSIAGGFAANKAYNRMVDKQQRDPLILARQIDKLQRRGEYVPPEMVFATLAASLSPDLGKHLDDVLEARTGTRLFNEALANPNNGPAIAQLMKDGTADDMIRTYAPVILDPMRPGLSASEQIAEGLNTGRVNARDLLDPEMLAIKMQFSSPAPQVAGAFPPVQPMRMPGVALAEGSDVEPPPLPGNTNSVREI